MFRFSFVLMCSIVLLISGCGPSAPQADKKGDSGPAAEHGAHGSGPHGGTIADWGGGKYHVEFTVDHGKKEATVYVLGSDEKTPTPVKASKLLLSINDPTFQVELAALPLADEPEGVSSRFVGTHENLGKVREFAGTISGEVDGTPFAGDFKEQPESHDHKH